MPERADIANRAQVSMKSIFVKSAPTVAHLEPSDLAEVAFVGRSNVGKSSLLNRLAGAKIARTSKTPGRTQMLNLFEVERDGLKFALVDLPGYGFADAPKAERASWMDMIEGYLTGRPNLRAVLVLVDVRRGVQEEDIEIKEWLEETSARVIPVGTKIDKFPKAKQKPALHAIASAYGVDRNEVIGTSGSTGQGIDALLEAIALLTQSRTDRSSVGRPGDTPMT
mgnify:CR=1 FL=1